MSSVQFRNYGKGIFPRPYDNIDPKNKDEYWMLNWCKWILSYGVQDRNNTPFSRVEKMEEYRSYAEGRQDTEQYYNALYSNINLGGTGVPVGQTDNQTDHAQTYAGREQRREAFTNVNHEILQIFPKYLKILHGKLEDIDFDITANAVDDKAGTEKESMKWLSWFEKINRPFIEEQYAMMGEEAQFESDFMPENLEELEIFEEAGGFKLKYEIAMELILKHNLDASKWHNLVRKLLYDDFVTLNMGAVKDYLDISTNKVLTEYVDISRLIIPYCKETEYQNPEFHGYYKYYKAADLRLRGIPEDKIRAASKASASKYGNIKWDDVLNYEGENNNYNGYAYDDFNIPCLECEWESVDTFYDRESKSKLGSTMISREYFDVGQKRFNDSKYQSREDRHMHRTDIRNRYKATWIIDTECIFDHGKIYDTARPNNKCRSSLHVFRLPGSSILRTCKPILDEIQISWLQLQNAIAKAAPPGVAVEFDALSNISTGMGNGTFHPLEVLQIRQQTGNLLYKVTPMGVGSSSRVGMASGLPIQELQGGVGNALAEFEAAFRLFIQMIQQNSGVSAAADASNPNPRESVKGNELALAGTQNMIKPMISGYTQIMENLAENMLYKVQVLLQQDKKVYEAYYPIVGKQKLKTLEIADGMAASDFGIALEPRATQLQKESLRAKIQEALKAGKNGVPAIKTSQAVMLEQYLEDGTSLKFIAVMLQYYERKSDETARALQQENITLQAEEKRKSDLQASQIEIQKMAQESQNRINETNAKGEQERLTEDKKHQHKMEELALSETIRKGAENRVPGLQ